jgi:hypothetical protein
MTLDPSVTADAIAMLRKAARDLQFALDFAANVQSPTDQRRSESYRVSAVANIDAARARVAE